MHNHPVTTEAKPSLLLIGYGQINQKVAQTLCNLFMITSVSRSHKTDHNAKHIQLDLVQEDLSSLPNKVDYILYCLTPAQFDEASYKHVFVDGLSKVIQHYSGQSIKRIVFVSSTSVYGQNQNEWVDETSPTEPKSFSGKVLVEAETLLNQSNIPSTIVRFSGIYGFTRQRLLTQILQGEKSSSPPSNYTNRIFEDDAVNVLCHILLLAKQKIPLHECYLASDCQPIAMHDVVSWIQSQIQCHPETGNERPSVSRTGSKRCRNQRLLDTGYKFLFPTYKDGYSAMIDRIRNSP